MIIFHSRNGSYLRGRLPRWRRGCRRMLMPRWRPCASSTTSTFRPTRLELSTFETVLASLGIREPLELLPSTGGASTLRSVYEDQYTASIFTENQQLRQNLEDADRVNAGLQADLNNAYRTNAELRVDVDHANRTNMQLHAALEDMTSLENKRALFGKKQTIILNCLSSS